MLGQMHAIETHVIGRLVEGDAIIEQLGEIVVRATDMVEKTYFHDVPGFSSCLAGLVSARDVSWSFDPAWHRK